MRKINGKLFLALLVGTFVLTGSVFAVHQFQYRRIAQALLWQAHHAEEQGQVARQARYLQRYLEFNPRDRAMKARLAEVWASEAFADSPRNRRWAVNLLDEVLLAEDNPVLRRLLIKTALEVRNIRAAREHLMVLLKWEHMAVWIEADQKARSGKKPVPLPENMAREDAARGELECYWGQVMEEDQKLAEAVACYRLAVRHAPELMVSYSRLAYLLRRTAESDPEQRKKNHDEADQVMNALVRRNTTPSESYLTRWRYRRDFDLLAIRETPRGQVPLEAAAEDVAEAVKRGPKSIEVLLAAADLERLRSRAAAEDTNRTPEERRQGMKQHRDRAEEYLRRGLELTARKEGGTTAQGEFQLLWHKGNLLLDDLDGRGRREEDNAPAGDDRPLKAEVKQVIGQIEKSRVPAAADYMRGRLFVHERRWAEAATFLERARALLQAQPDLACQADLYLGQCYEKLEEHTQMFNAYQRVAKFDATSVPALLGMAAARWAQGQLDDALAQYRAVMKQKRVPPRGWIDIARLEIQRQAPSEKPDWRDAELALAQAEKVNPPRAMVEIHLLRAELLLRQDRPDDARKLLAEARQKKPDEVEYWTALAELARRQNKPDEARQVLDEARKKLGDKVGLRLAQARLLSDEKGAGVAAAISKLAEDRSRFSDDDQARLLTGLADAQRVAGNAAEARKLWQTLAQLPGQKNDLRLQLLLFDLAMRDGDEPGMQKALNDIRDVEQASGAYHRYGQALYLIWQAKQAAPGERRKKALDGARAELDRVQRQRPSWPPVFLARAEIATMNGNPEQAIKDLQEAINNGEGSPAILRRLVSLLTERGRDGEAEFLMNRLKDAVRRDADITRMRVGIAIRGGQTDRALEIARQVVRDDTKDPKELVWMARVLAAANKAAEAEAKLQVAIKVGASDPLPWVAMVQFLVEQKRQDEALAVITRAKEKLPADEAGLALGRCYDAVQKPTEALRCYEQALARRGQDAAVVKSVAAAHLAASRHREAEPLLRQLVQGKLQGGTPADVAWGRRNLALVLASGTDYARFREALDLVGVKLTEEGHLVPDDSGDESTENQRARARVLASQNQRQFRLKAIELLEGLRTSNALTPDDQFVLAILYDAEGSARKAQDQLDVLYRRLQKQTPPQYLAQYALNLILQRRLPADLDQAEKVIGWLDELERQRRLPPNTFASVDLRGRLLEARKKGDEAVALLTRHITREGANPQEVVLLLACLSRLQRFDEAYALCEKTWTEGKCPPEVIGGVSVSLLGAMKPAASDAQVAAVEQHLKAALAKNPKSAVLMMHLAQLYDRRGQYEPAAQMYRAVLAQEPNNIIALNNLAWLLVHRAGNASEALGYINKAVNGIGRRAELLDTRGLVHLAMKDPARAVADLREAAQEAPTPTHLYHLARALHEDRNRTKAREVLMQAKEKGLEVARLHPVEQEACRLLLAEYGIR